MHSHAPSLHAAPSLRPHEPAPSSAITDADLRRAAWASALGSALEYYDFALYSLASALIFGPLFFPSQDPTTALIASFGTYFVGFAVRRVLARPPRALISSRSRAQASPVRAGGAEGRNCEGLVITQGVRCGQAVAAGSAVGT